MIDLSQLSPMMQHYMETKKEYPDCVLFYRLGDFYEMFFDDALTVSKELEITLTGKERIAVFLSGHLCAGCRFTHWIPTCTAWSRRDIRSP